MSKINDEQDRKIIEILRADSRRAFVDIGKEIGLSESAIRRRIKNLMDKGIIDRFTIQVKSEDKTSAITLLSINSSSDTSFVTSKLLELQGVKIVYEITGQYDIAAIISAESIIHINSCIDEIRKISGVSDSNTVIILNTLRQS